MAKKSTGSDDAVSLKNLSPIEKKLAKLEEQKQILLQKQSEQRKQAAQLRARNEAAERKSWADEVAHSLRKFFPMPASEIAERLSLSIATEIKQKGDEHE